MFGDMCCTFIPNNTAPDGSVTKALEGLRTPSQEMAENSGVDNSFSNWMTRLFGKWRGLILSLLTSITKYFVIILTCRCCCVPCIRALCVRFVTATVEKGTGASSNVQMPLLYTAPDIQGDVDAFL